MAAVASFITLEFIQKFLILWKHSGSAIACCMVCIFTFAFQENSSRRDQEECFRVQTWLPFRISKDKDKAALGLN